MKLAEDSISFYDDIGPQEFGDISLCRRSYLDAVDEIIIQQSSGTVYLDIGSGDGRRALKISSRIGTCLNYCLDSSREMHRSCIEKNLKSSCVTFDKYDPPFQCDVITCLWNVLGHMDDPVRNVKKMVGLLEPGGKLFVDVNNKWNVAEYGCSNVFKNMIFSKRIFEIKGRNAHVRLFSPMELDKAFDGTHLDKVYVDYKTGEKRCSMFKGQILYIATKK